MRVSASGRGRIGIRGSENDEDEFYPALTEKGFLFIRNPVLLYFSVGMIILTMIPGAGWKKGKKNSSVFRAVAHGWKKLILPAGTLLLILSVGLLVDVAKPVGSYWRTWDEEIHMDGVKALSILSSETWGGYLNRLITWHPGYLPLVLGYNLGELISFLAPDVPDIPYRSAVIVSTLVYGVMCSLAVKHTPRYKMTFFLVATIPTSLFQATSMTYDTVVTASVLLGTALLLEILEQPEKTPTQRLMFLAGLLSFGTVAKPAYSITLLLLWMIPGECFGSNRKKWLFRAVASLLFVWCLTAMLIPGAYDNVIFGDERFADTDSAAQMQSILAEPLGKGLLPFSFLWDNLYFLTSGGLDFWAYVGSVMPSLETMYFLLMLFIAPLCNPGEPEEGNSPLTARRRVVFAIVALFGEIMLIYAQYLVSSPVGGPIDGMQARYFIPLWILALLALMYPWGIRRRTGPAGKALAVATFFVCFWDNLENALLHLAQVGAL